MEMGVGECRTEGRSVVWMGPWRVTRTVEVLVSVDCGGKQVGTELTLMSLWWVRAVNLVLTMENATESVLGSEEGKGEVQNIRWQKHCALTVVRG